MNLMEIHKKDTKKTQKNHVQGLLKDVNLWSFV